MNQTSPLLSHQYHDAIAVAARDLWDEVLVAGRQHGFRNAQATVLAPTGIVSWTVRGILVVAYPLLLIAVGFMPSGEIRRLRGRLRQRRLQTGD